MIVDKCADLNGSTYRIQVERTPEYDKHDRTGRMSAVRIQITRLPSSPVARLFRRTLRFFRMG